MHETTADLDRLQRLLDDSHAAAGSHHRSIFDDAHRVGAAELCSMLTKVQVLCLATVTARGEPRVAPVDGLFYRGRWHFGSSPDSVRFRHLRRRPAVSAAHVRGEEFAVIAHGRARELDLGNPENDGFRRYLVEVYGGSWEDWGGAAPYAVIEAERLYTRLWVQEPVTSAPEGQPAGR
ncbi:MAG: pyridoxamine 5'-phosphate oxidase family protein [Acidimicrobiia bacterium]